MVSGSCGKLQISEMLLLGLREDGGQGMGPYCFL